MAGNILFCHLRRITRNHRRSKGGTLLKVITGMVDVFHQVPSTTMTEHQAKDNQLAPVLEWVREGKQPHKSRDISSSLKKHPATNVSIPSAYFKGWVSASSLHP